ncbi:MAG: alpha-glucan family phosphorylase [Candidatus Aminicenantes bacterium]
MKDMTNHYSAPKPRVAYLSMGAYLESYLPTYSGGLEVLAGDILRSCADRRIPIVGIIQASSSGYFRQGIDQNGWQQEVPVYWTPQKTLRRIPETVTLEHCGRELIVGAERYDITGSTGFKVPVYLLDTNFAQNDESLRQITGMLYDADYERRLAQENVLGQAGIKLMKHLGYDDILLHMNEGHAALGALQLLSKEGLPEEDVRRRSVFTTHTPVPAGHDVFDYGLANDVLGKRFLPDRIKEFAGHDRLNMTRLAVSLSGYINAVSRRHAEVCRAMDIFSGRKVDFITNGIHPETWAARPMMDFFDDYLPNWRFEPVVFERAGNTIPLDALDQAKERAKRYLMGFLNSELNVEFDQDVLTIVWARRFTDYKRPLLLFRDIDRLHQLAEKYGRIQVIFSGKAHPNDQHGKELIQKIIRYSRELKNHLRCAFIPGYNAKIARRLIGGADIWLNTPRRPLEASGTSGMKAALNGGLNLSSYDGWIVEGYEMTPEAVWLAGPQTRQVAPDSDKEAADSEDAGTMYDNLKELLNLYYRHPKALLRRRAQAVSLISWFNTDRCVREYADKAWRLSPREFSWTS